MAAIQFDSEGKVSDTNVTFTLAADTTGHLVASNVGNKAISLHFTHGGDAGDIGFGEGEEDTFDMVVAPNESQLLRAINFDNTSHSVGISSGDAKIAHTGSFTDTQVYLQQVS